MDINELDKLAALLKQERHALLSRWRQQVRQLPSARQLDVPTLNDHIPELLDELAAALQAKSDQTIPEALIEGSPPVHGLQRVQDAFDIEEVVAEYNILRGCLHDLADDNGLNLQGQPFHIINRVFDHAIGLALQTYATQRAERSSSGHGNLVWKASLRAGSATTVRESPMSCSKKSSTREKPIRRTRVERAWVSPS